MKILLVSGHTSGYNYSANTGENEGDLNIGLCKNVYTILNEYCDTQVYPYDRDMYRDLKAGKCAVDLKAFDYIFEIHFNASSNGEARGTSIYLHTDYTGGTSVEQGILNNLSAIGFKLRGTKGFNRKDTLLNMNTAESLGIDYALLETCFYDNKDDMKLYRDMEGTVAIGIADGILKGFGLYEKPDESRPVAPENPPESDGLYRVQVGAYRSKDNADQMLHDLEAAGFEGYIKKG